MLLQTFAQNLSVELVVTAVSLIITMVTSYVLLRERIVKNEAKTENIYEYIDSKNQIFENKFKEIQGDIQEVKDLNKDAAKSLVENTAAIRELKFVLEILKNRLGKID